MGLRDAYKSIFEALNHAGIANDVRITVRSVEAEELQEQKPDKLLRGIDGMLVPGGFGYRGIEGKVRAAQYARENHIPYFGICLGMQCAVIEFARHVADLARANSAEFDEHTPHPVISLMADQHNVTQLGGTMRLGAYACKLEPASRAAGAYRKREVEERHRHRFEFNNNYRDQLHSAGLRLCGLSPDEKLVEMVELPDHPWFIACQFHPEFQSTPLKPHPLFRDFVHAALQQREGNTVPLFQATRNHTHATS